MKQTTLDKLYTIDRTIRSVLNIAIVACLVLLVLASLHTSYKQFFTYALAAVAILCVILGIARLCLSPFVKSDEQEDFEQKLDYVLQQRAAQSKQSISSVSSDSSPLCNLSSEHQQQILSLFRQLPSHPDKPDAINMALVAQYLTAMEQLHLLSLSDKRALRLWVAHTTGKQVPATSHFNEAIPSTNRKEVAKARKQLEKILQTPLLS